MASKKKSAKKSKKRQNKSSKNTLWKASLLCTLVFPVLFILLKENAGEIGSTPSLYIETLDPSDITAIEPIQQEESTQPSLCSFEADATLEGLKNVVSSAAQVDTNSEPKYTHLTAFNEENTAPSNLDYVIISEDTDANPPSYSSSSDQFAIEIDISETPSDLELNSRLQIGADYTYLFLKPTSHSSFGGSLGGMQALYEYKPMNRFYGAATFAWKEGATHDSGNKRSILYFDVQEKLGYTFATENNTWVTSLFSGFGYRHMGQKLSQPGTSSLNFKYNEFYFPVGFDSDYAIMSWFSLGLDFTWMPQVYSTVAIHPLKGSRWSLTNTLSNIYVEVPFTFTLTQNKRFQLSFTPFYEYWKDGHSTAKLNSGIPLGLPGNTYNFFGADLNFIYQF